MKNLVPILYWLPRYRKSYLKNDLNAGLTVAIMLIPQGIACAVLAGLPPIMGLYAAMAPLVIYAILGTSKQLAVGPVALDSILLASGISLLAKTGSENYIHLAILAAVMVGFLQFLMGAARLGFLVNFLSNPVISGFTSAAAFIISFSQMEHILGMSIPGSQRIGTVIAYIIGHIEQIHPPTAIIGMSCIAALILLKRWRPNLPGLLIVVTLATLSVWLFDLNSRGVRIVGEVPRGFPTPSLPHLSLALLGDLLPIALTLAFVSFMEAIAIAKKFAAKNRYEVEANQEMMALGMANMAAGIFGGFSITGSLSRTAVNAHVEAHTALSSIITAAIIALTLLFLTPLLYFIPRAVLGAVIITAVVYLIDVKEVRRLFAIKRADFIVLIVAFCATLLSGVRYGILLSIGASLVMILRRISHPHMAFLGRVPGSEILRNMSRVPQALPIKGLIIIRMDASLYFTNISYLKDRLSEAIDQSESPVKAVIFDASSINEIDASAMSELFELVEEMAEEGIKLFMTNVKGPVRDFMKRAGFDKKLGSDHFFFSKKDAVRYYLGQEPEIPPLFEES